MNIAIIGNHFLTMGEAPFEDPDWQIWCQGSTVSHLPRWDRCIEIHDIDGLRELYKGNPDADPVFKKWLAHLKIASAGKTIFMAKRYDDIPNSIPYPTADMVKMFGARIFWTGPILNGQRTVPVRVRPAPFAATVCYSLAMAICELAPLVKRGEECFLGLWGVDMETEGEYRDQRAGVWYFLGVAAGMGINIVMPTMSESLKCAGLYGMNEEGEAKAMAARIRLYREDMAETLEKDIADGAAPELIERRKGALQAFKFMEREMA